MDKFECSICDNTYNDAKHRPRVLPCGHGFCTSCIETYILGGRKDCPVCRKEHGVNSAIDLPVNFSLEELLHKTANSVSQTSESDSDIAGDSIVMCPKHRGIPLYFHCKSHDVEVCHSCVVIDHPVSSCTLISLDDKMKEMKQSQIVNVKKQKQFFIDSEKELIGVHESAIDCLINQKNKKQDLEKEVELLLIQIEQIKHDIIRKERIHEDILSDLQGCQKNRKILERVELNLSCATSNYDIMKYNELAKTEILQSQKLKETLRKILCIREVSATDDIYAQVVKNNIRRSCKVFFESEKMFIPSLSKWLNLPNSAKLINEAELGLTSNISTVFMDLCVQGHTLGRVYIRVFGERPCGNHFIMQALGTDGPTLKGATFSEKNRYDLCLKYHVTETGGKSDASLFPLMSDDYKKRERGTVFKFGQDPHQAGFVIWTKTSESNDWSGYFGYVIEGMNIIDKAASTVYNIQKIMISECGIVLNY